VAICAADVLPFQEAGALVGASTAPLLRVKRETGTSPCGQGALSKSEAFFTSQQGKGARIRRLSDLNGVRFVRSFCVVRCCAPLAICAGFFLVTPQALASDNDESPKSSATVEALPKASSRDMSPPSDKYDVDRIGQRNVGHGINLYSLEKERALGQAMASAIDRGTRYVADPEVNGYVTRLAQNLARHSDAEVPFRVKVIDSSDHRVFSLPGGFLYIDRGLIAEVDSEAQLAALMAHEIAHVAARHATRLATRKSAWNMLSIPLIWASGPAALGTKQIGPLSLKKFSRDAEIEADLLGIEYQYAAGYDPNAFVEALEKLHARESAARANRSSLHDQIVRAFSNYPPTDDRIQRLQTEISSFLPPRNDYVLDTSEFQAVKAKVADRPILRRSRPGDGPAAGPVLRKPPAEDVESTYFAGASRVVTKGRLSTVFSYLPASRW
jgi:Zn-dependent protease with chaperone function